MDDAKTKPLSKEGSSEGGSGWLILYHRNGANTVPLPRGSAIVVGRDRPADVVIDDATLSRTHARLILGDGETVVEDLGSTNGTWLRGARIERAAIRPGEQLAFGAVSAMFHVHAPAPSLRLGLESHDRFVALLESEIVRAQYLGRPLALWMMRSLRLGEAAHLWHWAPVVQARLRPIDRAAVYSNDVLEVLAPELDEPEALALLRTITQDAKLLCGIAHFPACAATADSLLEAAREALKGATPQERVRIGDTRGARTLVSAPESNETVVGDSPFMQETMLTARRLAGRGIKVLLQGETGSGKEVVARYMHRHGSRSHMPMCVVNCGALPTHLIESVLFGHEKGAFTGATQRQIGVFEAASGGTVFLDEIAELPPEAQVKLLRVLEQKTITRIGDTKEIAVDVHLVSATNRDLEQMVADGAFRADLLYRLNTYTLTLPPLRERRDDIDALARRFLQLANEAYGTDVGGITPEALAALERYSWPGNVRELRNAMERAVAVAEGNDITLADLPERVSELGVVKASTTNETRVTASAACLPGEDFRSCMQRLEAEVILGALRDAGGNQTVAARRLGMPRRTFVRKVTLYQLRERE